MYGPHAKKAAWRSMQGIFNTQKSISYDELVANIVLEHWLSENTAKNLIKYAEIKGRCDIENGIVHSNSYHEKVSNKKLDEFK